MGVVIRRYIDFLILLIPTPTVLAAFLHIVHFKNVFLSLSTQLAISMNNNYTLVNM